MFSLPEPLFLAPASPALEAELGCPLLYLFVPLQYLYHVLTTLYQQDLLMSRSSTKLLKNLGVCLTYFGIFSTSQEVFDMCLVVLFQSPCVVTFIPIGPCQPRKAIPPFSFVQ